MITTDTQTLKEILDEIRDTDWETIFKREEIRITNGQLKVANKEYCNWLESFMNNLPEGYEDEAWAYKTLKHNQNFTKQDLENERHLSNFHTFLDIVADIQRVKEYYDPRDFEEYEYVFKYNNIYYEWNTLVGQGAITTIKKIEKPDFAFIDLDLYFEKQEEGNPMKKYKYYNKENF